MIYSNQQLYQFTLKELFLKFLFYISRFIIILNCLLIKLKKSPTNKVGLKGSYVKDNLKKRVKLSKADFYIV